MLGAIGLALLPKCPLRLAAWFGMAAAAGAGSWLTGARGFVLGGVLLAAAMPPVAVRGWRARDARPLLVGLAGAAALLGGRYGRETLLAWSGVALILAASMWSARPRRSTTALP
jgi:hypothetical protein